MAQNQRPISQEKKYPGLNISLSDLTAHVRIDKGFCLLFVVFFVLCCFVLFFKDPSSDHCCRDFLALINPYSLGLQKFLLFYLKKDKEEKLLVIILRLLKNLFFPDLPHLLLRYWLISSWPIATTKYLHILSYDASEGGVVQNDWADLLAEESCKMHSPFPHFPSLYPVPLYDTPYPLHYSGTHQLHIKIILLTKSAEYFSFFWLY